MDSQGGWRWQLRPEAQPVSYLDPLLGQWVSGSFDTAVKSEHRAVRSSGVQPQATAGQVPQLPSQTIHQLQSDVNRHEQAELRRQESGAAPQPMPMPTEERRRLARRPGLRQQLLLRLLHR